LSSLPVALRPPRFLDLWTLKESYVKARGLGLSIPLDRLEFDFCAPHGLALRFSPHFDDAPARWQVWQCHPRARHAVAVCAERGACGSAAPLRLLTHEIEPLRRMRPMALPITRQSV
jgi:4'-phosphopantetheinyl transferase